MALGGFLAQPGAAHPTDLYAAAFLLEAGADRGLIVDQVDRTREAARSHHTTATTGGPPNGGHEPG